MDRQLRRDPKFAETRMTTLAESSLLYAAAALALIAPSMASARGGRLAFVSSGAAGTVTVVDLAAEKVLKTLPTRGRRCRW